MELDVAYGPGLVVDVHLFEERDERNVRDRFLMVLHPAVALGRTVMVVESHTGRDDVDDGRSAMGDRGLDQWNDLLAVAAEGAGDERAAQRDGDRTRIDRLEGVDSPFLLHGAEVGGG